MSDAFPLLDTRTPAELRAAMTAAASGAVPRWSSGDGEPGTALIETVARMTDRLAAQLNRVPDKNAAEVLARLGNRPVPVSAARGTVSFSVASVLSTGFTVPAGTQIATQADGDLPPVRFTTTAPASLSPVTLVEWGFLTEERPPSPAPATLHGSLRRSFPGKPADEASLVLVLQRSAPGECVTVDALLADASKGAERTLHAFTSVLAEARVWEWETSTTQGNGIVWEPCQKVTETFSHGQGTYSVRLRLPDRHHTVGLSLSGTGTAPAHLSGALLRVRSVSPKASGVEIRSTRVAPEAPVVHGTLVPAVELGISTGEPGQRFSLPVPPQPTSWPLTLQVITPETTATWTYLPSLTGSGPQDHHFTLDPNEGSILLAPQVAHTSGIRQHGAVPPAGARIRLDPYITGGGTEGNLPKHTLTVLPTPVPGVSAVTNEEACTGGADGETDEHAAKRRPTGAVNPARAVTAADYEQTIPHVAPEVARVCTLPVREDTEGTVATAVTVSEPRPATTDLTFSLTGAATRSADVVVPAGTTVWPEPTTESPAVPFTTDHNIALRLSAGSSFRAPFGPAPWRTYGPTPQATPGDVEANPDGSVTFVTALPEGIPLAEAILTLHLEGDLPAAPPRLTVAIHHADGGRTRLTGDRDSTTVLPLVGKGGSHVCALRLKDTSGWTAASRRTLAHTLSESLPDEEHLTAQGFPPRATAWLTCILAAAGGEHSNGNTRPDITPTPHLLGVSFCRSAATVGSHQCQTVPAGTPLLTSGTNDAIHLPAWPAWGPLPTITTHTDTTEQTWTLTADAQSTASASEIIADPGTGTISFGQDVRYTDGTVRRVGVLRPAPGSDLRTGRDYRTTQGNSGNLPPGVLTLHTLDIPGLTVTNPAPARGGADPVIENRLETAPDVEILVMPHVAADAAGQLNPSLLEPSPGLIERIQAGLKPIQPPGLNVRVEAFECKVVNVTAELVLDTTDEADKQATLAAARTALNQYLNPLTGGPNRTGWPLGRSLHKGETYRVLQRVPGVKNISSLDIALSNESRTESELVTIGPFELLRSGTHTLTESQPVRRATP